MTNGNRNRLYLIDIAKENTITDHNDILSALMPYDIIYTSALNADRSVKIPDSDLTIKVPRTEPVKVNLVYLQEILRKKAWVGDVMESTIILMNDNPYEPGRQICPMRVIADDSLSISVEDLFVYESEFAALQDKHSDIFSQKQPRTQKEENNLYLLVGILLDMLVKKGRNAVPYSLPDPEGDNKYIFKSQAALIRHIIEEYAVYGLRESSLENKFSKANDILEAKIK